MKCLYYLSDSLDDSKNISQDLKDAGLHDFYLHVISKDESGLVEQRIQSSNYLETLDLFRGSTIGGMIGFSFALILAALESHFQFFGIKIPTYAYLIIFGFFTLFGIWEGGLFGVDTENQKIEPFKEDLDNGKYLILVYADKEEEDGITNMMRAKHPEEKLVGVDTHFINPFKKLSVT